MKIETALSCGDLAWCISDGDVCQLTVGKVQVEVVDTPGINGGAIEPGYPDIQFDNFMPKSSYQETYMMVETGVGSGRLYRLNEHVFASRQEAEDRVASSNT